MIIQTVRNDIVSMLSRFTRSPLPCHVLTLNFMFMIGSVRAEDTFTY